MRNETFVSSLSSQGTALVSEHNKHLVVAAAKLSGVKLEEIERRTGVKKHTVQSLVKKFGKQAEELRQMMRADPNAMRNFSFDRLFETKPGDVSVDRAMLQHKEPTWPIPKRKGLRRAVRQRTRPSRISTQALPAHALPLAAPSKPALPKPAPAATPALVEDENVLERSALACANFVLSRLQK